MKIVHLSTTDLGGAYKAVERLHKGMLQIGIDSTILLRTKFHEESTGIQIIDNPISCILSKTKNLLNIIRSSGEIISDYYGTDISRHPIVRESDAIIVHWCNSFISYEGIKRIKKLNKPVFVVAHDMWSYTGGCHYDDYCDGYLNGCENCPRLAKWARYKAYRNYREKLSCYDGMKLICPSEWSVETAKKSVIWKDNSIYKVYNSLDYDVFHPLNKAELNRLKIKYNIPDNGKKIILYGANLALKNTTKGGNALSNILSGLDSDYVQLVVYGNDSRETIDNCPIDVTYLGYIRDEMSMAEIYNIADVFLAPSKQESFCYTVNEALACGTPVVAYRVGGIAEQVIHKKNGYLAEYGVLEDLTDGIIYCLSEQASFSGNLSYLDNSLKKVACAYASVIEGRKI